MKKQFLTDLITLIEELKEAGSFKSIVVSNEIYKLYDDHIETVLQEIPR